MKSTTEPHPLLEADSPSYTHATIRRAFIVWLRCGQKNDFRDVCNYYHRLEAMEEQLPADHRALSREKEFSLFTHKPPTSSYLNEYFPQLYASPPLETQMQSQAYAQGHYLRTIEPSSNIFSVEDMKQGITPKDIFAASQVFKAPVQAKFDEKAVRQNGKGATHIQQNGRDATHVPTHNAFAEALRKPIPAHNVTDKQVKEDNKCHGTSKREIIETSQMIKNFCKDKQVPLKTFLENFKEYASRCDLVNTVTNIGFYIKRKMVQDEIKVAVNIQRLKRVRSLERKELPNVDINDKGVLFINKPKESQVKNILEDVTTSTEAVTKNEQKSSESNDNNSEQLIDIEIESPVNGKIIIDNVSNDHESSENAIKEKVSSEEHNDDGECNESMDLEDKDTKNTAGFSNSHLMKFDTQKCRKI